MQRRNLPTILGMIFVISLVTISAVWAADNASWPGWRGVNRDGKSTDTGLLKTWPQGGPKLLWEAQGLGNGYSSPAVVDGVTYVTGEKSGTLYLYAYDETGKQLYAKPIGPEHKDRRFPGSRSTPTYDNGKLYLESGNGLVGCYNAKTGEKIWSVELSKFGGRKPGWGFSESVLIVGNIAVVTSGGGQMSLLGLNKVTGQPIWRSAANGDAHYSSPIYVEYQGVPMIIQGMRNGLMAVNPKNGKTLWRNNFAAGNTANCPTPAYSDGYVFWAVGYGKGAVCVKMTVNDANVSAKEVYQTKDMVCHHGGYVIVGDYVYGNHNGEWVCLELKTGKKMWSGRGPGKGSICFADGMLYLFGENGGRVSLVKAIPEQFEEVGKFQVSGTKESWAHPIVIGGKLYLRYGDKLYCYDVKA